VARRPLLWLVDDRPPSEWATLPRGLEHAACPGAERTLCGRGVWQFAPPTVRPSWPPVRRCYQCARRAVAVFTVAHGHVFNGTRARPLCGRLGVGEAARPRPAGEVCGLCLRSLDYVTRWRQLDVPAVQLVADALPARGQVA